MNKKQSAVPSQQRVESSAIPLLSDYIQRAKFAGDERQIFFEEYWPPGDLIVLQLGVFD
jgi:hypothetical protein